MTGSLDPAHRRVLAAPGFTGVGSLPGTQITEAVALAFDASPTMPWLPELPGRGAGADMIGRTLAAMNSATGEWGFDLQPAGWRLTARPGLDAGRAAGLLDSDIDALLAFGDFDGTLKTQLAGPWTTASSVELSRGGRALRDRGAVRDIVEATAAAALAHVDAVRRRVPRAEVVLQLDEPALPLVVEGGVPTESGLGRISAVTSAEATAALGAVIDAAGVPVVVHCCGDQPQLALLADAGAAAVSFDAMGLVAGTRRPDENLLGGLVERGVGLWLGVLPALGPGVPPPPRTVADPVRRLWRNLGFPPAELAASVTLTAACGLAGASTGWARESLRILGQAARALSEAPEILRG